MAARAQLARGQFLLADVEQQQRLHAVHVGLADALEFVLDHVEQLAMQPLDEIQALKIARLDALLILHFAAHARCRRLAHDPSLLLTQCPKRARYVCGG